MMHFISLGTLSICLVTQLNASDYPETPVRPVVHQYGSVELRDSFAWLEVMDTETEDWFRAQDAFSRDWLESLPGWQSLFDRLKDIDDTGTAHVKGFHRRNERYFHYQRDVGEEVYSLYYRDGIESPSKLIVDPNAITHSSTICSIQYFNPSFDGKLLLVGIAEGGNEIPELFVIEVESGRVVEPPIPRVRYFPHWLPDNTGFYYTQMRPIDPADQMADRYKRMPAKFHQLGGNAALDPVVVSITRNPSLGLSEVDLPLIFPIPGTNITRLRILHAVRQSSFYFARDVDPRLSEDIKWTQISSSADQFRGINIYNNAAYILSFKDAPNGKILRLDLERLDRTSLEEFLPESHRVLQGFRIFGDRIYVNCTDSGVDTVLTRDMVDPDDPFTGIRLPFARSVELLANDYTKSDLFLKLEGWVRESAYYRYDPSEGVVTPCTIRPTGPYDVPENLVVEHVVVNSHDGVEIPMTIIREPSVECDGKNPVILTGYGAYGISSKQEFDPLYLPWYEAGGIRAIAHVRGGGEFGEAWHTAGHIATKRNSWLDLNACAEFLIDHQYAGKGTIGIVSASMGGVLVGRAMTSRPDLYGAVISIVGCHNPVRIHRQANGPVNFSEFGNPMDPEEFPYVLAMDSYFAVKDGIDYPPMLITAGWNDARVEPWEPGKMAARMQAANPDGGPYLLRVGFESGHRIVARTDRLEAFADSYAFLLWALKSR